MRKNYKWNIYHGLFEGNVIILRSIDKREKVVGDKKYSIRLGIAIPLQDPQSNGLPSDAENQVLNQIEDEIFDLIEEVTIVSMIITTNNMREFVFYSVSDSQLKSIIKALSDKFPNYEFQSYSEPDPNWSLYNQLMLELQNK